MYTSHIKNRKAFYSSKWGLAVRLLFLFALGACSEPKKDVEAHQVQHLINRLDTKIYAAKKAYEEFMAEVKNETASAEYKQFTLEYIKNQRTSAEKTIAFEGSEYVENETGFLKHVAVRVLLGYESAIENGAQALFDQGISAQSKEGQDIIYQAEVFILSMTQMYEGHKQKLIAQFKQSK